MVLLVTFGFEFAFGWALGPLPTIVLVFIVYGIGYAWTRSPSDGAAEEDEEADN